jgi:hypothetical protein
MTETRVVRVDCRAQEPMRKETGLGFLFMSRFLAYQKRVFVLSPPGRAVDARRRIALVRLRFAGSAITCVTLHHDDDDHMLYRLRFCRVVDATEGLLRLQRWFIRRLRGRRLAVCMGLHARLGVGCLLAALDEELVRAFIIAPRTATRGAAQQSSRACGLFIGHSWEELWEVIQ